MDKKEAWDFALGMIKVDGLEPTPEFLELVEKEIRGEISEDDILEWIKKTYGAADGGITETLVGVLQHDYDDKEIRAEKAGEPKAGPIWDEDTQRYI